MRAYARTLLSVARRIAADSVREHAEGVFRDNDFQRTVDRLMGQYRDTDRVWDKAMEEAKRMLPEMPLQMRRKVLDEIGDMLFEQLT